MDLLTQKGRGKNVKIDVVLGKTLGILGHAEFFTQSQYVETIFIPGIAERFRRHTTRLFHGEAIGAVPHSWQVTASNGTQVAAQAGRWLASMKRAIVQVIILALWLAWLLYWTMVADGREANTLARNDRIAYSMGLVG